MAGFRFLVAFPFCALLGFGQLPAHAQGPGPFAAGIPQTLAAQPLTCRQFRGTRDAAPAISRASLVARNGELRVESDSALIYRIPGAAERQTIISGNGARPGTDHVYYVDKAETGTGYFWFEVNYDGQSAVGDSRRHELFVNESGEFVSYTFIARLRQPDQRVGVTEYTVRCEPV